MVPKIWETFPKKPQISQKFNFITSCLAEICQSVSQFPAKYSDSPKKLFCFSPKRPLELTPPLRALITGPEKAIKTYFYLFCVFFFFFCILWPYINCGTFVDYCLLHRLVLQFGASLPPTHPSAPRSSSSCSQQRLLKQLKQFKTSPSSCLERQLGLSSDI